MNKTTKFLILLVVLALMALLLAFIFSRINPSQPVSYQYSNLDNETLVNSGPSQDVDDGELVSLGEKLRVRTPRPNAKVTGQIVITGEVGPGMFFEGSFPIEIRDAEGTVLDTTIAQAQGEWMTDEFVPFSAVAHVAYTGTSPQGTIVFRNDNASGLPENDISYEMPIKLVPAKTTMEVYPHFLTNVQGNCSETTALSRMVPVSQNVARATILQLLAGLSSQEQQAGYNNAIGYGVVLNSLTIEEGVAHVDFNEKLDSAGSCLVTGIRAQIEDSLQDIPGIDLVVISIEGKTDTILQP